MRIRMGKNKILKGKFRKISEQYEEYLDSEYLDSNELYVAS